MVTRVRRNPAGDYGWRLRKRCLSSFSKWECAAPGPIKQPDVEPQAQAGLWSRLECAGNRDERLDLINEKIILGETYLNCCGFEHLFELRSNPGFCPG